MPSVAATYEGKVVVGGIYDLHREEVFYTVRGRGPLFFEKRIHMGLQETIGDVTCLI
jgi:fructose-1,6-bisphosphatase/inositol monophosphatase family enzyme